MIWWTTTLWLKVGWHFQDFRAAVLQFTHKELLRKKAE